MCTCFPQSNNWFSDSPDTNRMFCNEITSYTSYLEIAHLTRQMPVHVLGCRLPFQTLAINLELLSTLSEVQQFTWVTHRTLGITLLAITVYYKKCNSGTALFIIKNVTQEQPKERAAQEESWWVSVHSWANYGGFWYWVFPRGPYAKGLPPWGGTDGREWQSGFSWKVLCYSGEDPWQEWFTSLFSFFFCILVTKWIVLLCCITNSHYDGCFTIDPKQ